MSIEQRIETQRLKLLRLLAGWLSAVVFLSAVPIAPAWSRWVRGFLSSVLERAEVAAQCLVFVEARRIARECGGEVDRAWLSRQFDLLSACDSDEPPSLAALRRRLGALRCLLENLPHRGLRLLQRMTAARDAEGDPERRAPCGLRQSAGLLATRQCYPPRPWHPPEPALLFRFL